MSALRNALALLPETHRLELQCVMQLPLCVDLRAHILESGAPLLDVAFHGFRLAPQAVDRGTIGLHCDGQLLYFALPGQDAMQFAVRSMKTHSVAREDMPVARYQRRPGRQRLPRVQSCGGIGHDVDILQPYAYDRPQSLLRADDVAPQWLEAGKRRALPLRILCRDIESGLAGRAIAAEPARGAIEPDQPDAIQPLAQNSLQRILPARFD